MGGRRTGKRGGSGGQEGGQEGAEVSAAPVDQTPGVLWGPTPGPGAEVPLRSWSAESVLKDPVLLEPLLCLCSCLLGPRGGC